MLYTRIYDNSSIVILTTCTPTDLHTFTYQNLLVIGWGAIYKKACSFAKGHENKGEFSKKFKDYNNLILQIYK